MKRDKLGIDPADWLSSGPNPLSAHMVSGVLASFSNPPVVYRFTGPARLLRATGKNASGAQAAAYSGGYWVDERVIARIDAGLSQYAGWLSNKFLAESARAKYRAGTAICEDWNDLSEFHRMVVPDGEIFDGLAGPVKQQPQRSAMNLHSRHTPMLMGGFEQIFLKVRNPFWIFEALPL